MDLTGSSEMAQAVGDMPGAPVHCPFDPDAPATIADPYPHYRRLRRDAPVLHLPDHDLWVVTRHADVVAVLADTRRYSSALGMGAQADRPGPRSVDYRIGAPGVRVLIATDPPEHTAFRSAVSASFRASAVARLAPRVEAVAGRLVADMIDAQAAGRELDLYRDLADPLPVLVLAELFGVSPGMQGAFREWASAGEGERPALGRGYDMFRYFSREIRDRLAHPRDDLLSLVSRSDGAGLSSWEVMAFCAFLLVAGIETTTNLLTNLVATLVAQPELQARLWAEPTLVDAAVDEALRHDTSVQALWRTTTEPVVLGGVEVPAHARLLVVFGSANRDGDVFERPDEFVLGRSPNPHVAFGFGPHRCLGARLARSELRAALQALIARTGGIEAAGEFVRTGGLVLRGFVAQPVRLLPAGAPR
jgi:cytochrome P450